MLVALPFKNSSRESSGGRRGECSSPAANIGIKSQRGPQTQVKIPLIRLMLRFAMTREVSEDRSERPDSPTMIPSLSSCRRRMTGGERRFAERLQARLEGDYLVWYDVPLGRARCHPDFVILHPRRGLLVLEVKDWKLDTLRSISPTRVELLTNRGLVHELNPLEQARHYAQQIADLLKADAALTHAHGRYRGKLLFPWGYGVVLPNITRQQFDTAELAGAISPHLAICRDEMYEDVDAEDFQKRLWDMFPWALSKPLTVPQIDRIRWHLHPELRLGPAAQQELSIDAVPDVIAIMDVQQEQLARSLGEGHRVIHGVAGSGKTMILAYRCLHLTRTMHKPVLVLCYNRTLASRLNGIMQEKGVGPLVNVRNFHAWCRDQLVQYHVPLPASTNNRESYANKLVEQLIHAVKRGQVPRAQYGAVLIDEGHDFEPEWLQVLVQMIDPDTDSLLLLYDDAQSIYSRNRRKFSFRSVGVQAQGRTTILRLNYRNTAEVLKVAYEFAKDELTPKEADEDGIPLILPETANRHGPDPELTTHHDLSEEGDQIARRLQALHHDGVPWSEMGVLYRSRFIGEEVAARLRKADIPVSWLRAGPAKHADAAGDTVKLVTFHSSKGLEFSVVAIPGLGFLPGSRAVESDEVRLAYVAMTRAMNRLIMTCHRRSAFVGRLLESGAALAA